MTISLNKWNHFTVGPIKFRKLRTSVFYALDAIQKGAIVPQTPDKWEWLSVLAEDADKHKTLKSGGALADKRERRGCCAHHENFPGV